MLINQKTLSWVQSYMNRPGSALIIDSPDDIASGLEIAKYIHGFLINSGKRPLIRVHAVEKKSIGVDEMRALQKTLSLKADVISSDAVTRIAVIEGAEQLTIEAQNALLKLIEEQPERTIVLLITTRVQGLLDTIRSRCMSIAILPLQQAQVISYAAEHGIATNAANRAYILSEGRRSVFLELIQDDSRLNDLMGRTKRFLASTAFQRQSLLQQIIKQDEVAEFLQALLATAKAGMRNSTTLDGRNRWKQIVSQIVVSRDQLAKNVSPKLALLDLSIHL